MDLGLRNDYLNQILFSTSRYFCGVNNLPKTLHTHPIFSTVINVDGHFVTLIGRPDKLMYVDSFGLPPSDREIVEFITEDVRPCLINSTTYQHPLSIYCGFFSIFFVLFSEIGRTITLQRFDLHNLEQNDEICITNLELLLEAAPFLS